MSFKELSIMSDKKGTVLFYPYIPKKSIKILENRLSTRWIGQGPLVDKFELKFKSMFAKKNHCLATGSGTDALHLSYILSGLKKGDEVIVKVGKDKGKIGKIAKVFNSIDKVIITGVNVSKKHQKPSQDSKGGIVNKEMPVHISNILAYDQKSKKSSKVGFKVEDGKKVRILKSSREKY